MNKKCVKEKPETKDKGKLKKGKTRLNEGSKSNLKTTSAQVKHHRKHHRRLEAWLKKLLKALSS